MQGAIRSEKVERLNALLGNGGLWSRVSVGLDVGFVRNRKALVVSICSKHLLG